MKMHRQDACSKFLLALCWFAAALPLAGGTCLAETGAALVIGNDAYPDEARLESCVSDARAFRKWLHSIGYELSEITLLTDATANQMAEGLEDLAQRAEKQRYDQVMIYYSGHGMTVDDDDGDEGADDGMDEALVAIDHPVSSIDQCLIRDDQLYRYLRRISARTDQLILVLDCCFSGGAIKGDRSRGRGRPKRLFQSQLERLFVNAGPPTATPPRDPPARLKGVALKSHGSLKDLNWEDGSGTLLFFSAATEIQTAQAGAPGQLSAYTNNFLHLMDRAFGDQRQIKLSELQDALKKSLDGKQTPGLEVHGMTDDVVIKSKVFADPKQVAIERKGSQILGQLIALDGSSADPNWKVDAACSAAGPVPIGQFYHLRVRPSHDGFLVVFTVEAHGETTFFFPNKSEPDNRVKAGVERAIPWEEGLEADGVAGTERFYVFLLDQNPFASFDFAQSPDELLMGRLSDLIRRNPSLGSVQQLQEVLEKPAAATGAAKRSWTKSVLQVQTVNR